MGLRRGRDAGAAAALRRRVRAPFRHALERARRRPLPAHRDRAVSQATDRGRARARLRARQGLPQRGRPCSSTTRSSRCSSGTGVRRLPRHHVPDREPGGAAGEVLDDGCDVSRPRDRARRPLGADPVRRGARAPRAVDARSRRAPCLAHRARESTPRPTRTGRSSSTTRSPTTSNRSCPAHDRPRLSRRAVAVRAPHGRRPDADRAVRVLRRRDGARERVHGRSTRRLCSRRGSTSSRSRSRASEATSTTSRRSPTGCPRPAGSASASTAS